MNRSGTKKNGMEAVSVEVNQVAMFKLDKEQLMVQVVGTVAGPDGMQMLRTRAVDANRAQTVMAMKPSMGNMSLDLTLADGSKTVNIPVLEASKMGMDEMLLTMKSPIQVVNGQKGAPNGQMSSSAMASTNAMSERA